MKICLVSSGGGHINELLQLSELYKKYPHFIVSNKTALTLSIPSSSRVYLIDNLAFGLVKENIANSRYIITNLLQSIRIFLAEKPEVVITTGAGVAFWMCVVAKFARKKVIYIETIARITKPSLFGRIVYFMSDLFIVQWKPLLTYFKKAVYGGLIFSFEDSLQSNKDTKDSQIFVTVGSDFKFERLVSEIIRLKQMGAIPENIIIQANDEIDCEGVTTFRSCPQDKMDQYLKESHVVITHGGIGSILNAIRFSCKVIAVPRKSQLKEHYDDHQFEIVKEFGRKGLILECLEISELGMKLRSVSEFVPKFPCFSGNIRQLVQKHINEITPF